MSVAKSIASNIAKQVAQLVALADGGVGGLAGIITASDTTPDEGDTLTLTFTETSIIGDFTASDLTPDEGDTLTLTFTEYSYTYQWSFDGSPLSDGGDISGATTDELTVANVDTSGVYSIAATNTTTGAVRTFPITIAVIPIAYDADAIDYFTRAEGLGGSFNLSSLNPLYGAAYVKLRYNTFVANIKNAGYWNDIADIWLPFGVNGPQASQILKLKHSGNAAIRTEVPEDEWYRWYCPCNGSIGFHSQAVSQLVPGPGGDPLTFLNSNAFDGLSNGSLGVSGFSYANSNSVNGILIDGTSISDLGENTSSVYLYSNPGDAFHMRLRMHGPSAVYGAYTTNKMIGHWHSHRNGTALKSILNGSTIGTQTGASLNSTAKDFSILRVYGQFVAAWIAPGISEAGAAFVSAEIKTLVESIGFAAPADGVPTAMIEGDSLSMGSSSEKQIPYANYLRHKSGLESSRFVNFSRSGFLVPEAQARHALCDQVVAAGFSVKKVVLSLIGTNDLGNAGDSSATVIANLESYWTAVKADGWSLVAMTIPPRDDAGWDGTKETERLAVNTAIRASMTPDYIFDLDAWFVDNSILPSNTTYYRPDKLHFTSFAGSEIADAIHADSSITALFA